ncbi:unnamed protein product [Allacma fusca]|uniref:O-acyltransferase WSD1 C-terminal domain-containing protein n=1 Tax=Allacma fusca TaxID=39272 RepID=A0A8J2NML9_9HEXA|nr:unnamed protein product [Allacma fusca]
MEFSALKRFSYFLAAFGSYVFFYGILVPLYTLCLIYRGGVLLIARLIRPDLEEVVSDPKFLSAHPGTIFSNIVVCFVIDGRISATRIQEMYEERVINLVDSNGRVYKKLSQFWVPFLSYAFWKSDPKFNLKNHIRDFDQDVGFSKPCDQSSLLEVLPKLMDVPWKSNRSPWEVLVVSNFQGPVATRSSQTLLIFRSDHMLGDFHCLLELFRVLFNSPFLTPGAKRNNRDLSFWQKLKFFLAIPLAFLTSAKFMLQGRYLGARRPGNGFICDVSKPISGDIIKDIRIHFNVKFATVLHSATIAAVAGAIENSGRAAPEKIDMSSVLPIPGHPGGLNNHMSLLVANFPCKSGSSVERLLGTERILKDFETASFPMACFFYGQMISNLPYRIANPLFNCFSHFFPSLFLTTLPTTLDRDFVDGAEIVDAFALSNPVTPLGMFIPTWGVNNQHRISFCLDPTIFKQPGTFSGLSQYFRREIEVLHESISVS